MAKKAKNILIEEEDKKQLGAMAALSGKDLKAFIGDLLSVVVEFKDFSSVKWLVKQVNKK